MFTSVGKIIVHVNDMICLWVDTISLTKSFHMIIPKYVRYAVNMFNHNNSLVASPFLWRELHLIYLTNRNHSPHLWNNFICMYLMKVISMLALLRHKILSFFNFFLQKQWWLHSWQPCGIIRMVVQIGIVLHQLFMCYHVLL